MSETLPSSDQLRELRERWTDLYPKLCQSCGMVRINLNARLEDVKFGDSTEKQAQAIIEQDAQNVSMGCGKGEQLVGGCPPYKSCSRSSETS